MSYNPFRVVEKPWGKEKWISLTDKYCLKEITLYANCKTSLQYHVKKEETMYFLKGKAIVVEQLPEDLEIGTKSIYEIKPGFILHCKPGHIHRIEALDEDVVYVESSTAEVDDVVRLEDSYGRK